jgi:hypothetical protein
MTKKAARWDATVVDRQQVSKPGRVFRVFRVVASQQQRRAVAAALAASRSENVKTENR